MDETDDLELIAVISAAIAAAEGDNAQMDLLSAALSAVRQINGIHSE